MISVLNATTKKTLSGFGIKELTTLGLKDKKFIRQAKCNKLTRQLFLDARSNLVVKSVAHWLAGDREYVDILPSEGLIVARILNRNSEEFRKGIQLISFKTCQPIHIKVKNSIVNWSNWTSAKATDYGFEFFQDEFGNVQLVGKDESTYSFFIPACNISKVEIKPILNKVALMASRNASEALVAMAMSMPTDEFIALFNFTQQEITQCGYIN